jgi:hypothetical protein
MLFGFILILLALTGGSLFIFRPAWFPAAISAEALAWDRQFNRTLWITGIIFLMVQILLAWTILRARKKSAASPGNGNRGLVSDPRRAGVARVGQGCHRGALERNDSGLLSPVCVEFPLPRAGRTVWKNRQPVHQRFRGQPIRHRSGRSRRQR